MKLYYYKGPQKNFGDDLNAWLWDRLLPNFFDDDASVTLSGIGTIIGKGMSKTTKWIVLSSGVGYHPPPADFGSERWNIQCVRGPLSAEVLGLPPEKAITDGAITLSLLPEYTPLPESERHGVVFMPHHNALIRGRWRAACEAAGIEFLDPEADDIQTLERIRSAKLVIADAMHAAIVADTFRVQWIPVATSSEINTFKWLDWTLSMQLPHNPFVLPATTRREAIRSFLLTISAENYFLKGGTKDDVILHFKRMRSLKTQIWWPIYRRVVGLGFRIGNFALTLYDKMVEVLPQRSTQKHHKIDKRIQEAAQALRAAAQSKPCLSSDEIFETRKQQMMTCLKNVRALAD